MTRVLADLAAVAVALVAPQPAVPRFAPPEGRPVLYETIERRDLGTGDLVLRTLRELRFTRNGDGWIVTSRIVDLSGEGPEQLVALLSGPMRLMQALDLRWKLDAQGRDMGPVDADADWQPLASALATMRANLSDAPPGLERITRLQLVSSMAALDGTGRRALLWGEVAPMLPLAKPGSAWQRVDGGDGGLRRASAEGTRSREERLDADGLLAEARIEERIEVGTRLRVHHRLIRRLPDARGA